MGITHRNNLLLLVLPVVFLVLYLVYPLRQFHWDVLERAYLLEHPVEYLHTWDGSPRSQFLSFAHVLELPLASPFRLLVPGGSGLRTLCLFEALMSAVTLLLLGELVRFWRSLAGARAGGLRAAVLAQVTFGVSLASWKMGSSGQERVLALATQLLFLWCFWRTLAAAPRAAADPAPRSWTTAVAWPVAGALALAILSHLTGAVLVPFALGALLLLPPAWQPGRARVARAVVVGALCAGIAYYAVAAWTTHVRGPGSFIDYLTFFHRSGGNNFWEPTGAPVRGPGRLVRLETGMASFFAGPRRVGEGTLLLLALAIFAPVLRIWGPGVAAAATSGAKGVRAAAGTASSPITLATLRRHALLLGAVWTAHFAFFEPHNFESWTLVAALLLLVAAASLPSGRVAWLAAVLPALLVAVNLRHYAAGHRPFELEGYRRIVARETRPGDIVLLAGGIQNRKSLSGSVSMRYFLAKLPHRTIASLYDVMGVSQPEYWGRPFASPAELQSALDAGRHAYVPGFLEPELRRANDSGLVRITYAARGDSLVEISRIEAR